MPRIWSAALNDTTPRGASPKAKLDKLLEKVKAPKVSSTARITRLTVNSINLYLRDARQQKAARTWVLAVVVVAGCSFGSGWGWPCEPTRKHPVKRGNEAVDKEAPFT